MPWTRPDEKEKAVIAEQYRNVINDERTSLLPTTNVSLSSSNSALLSVTAGGGGGGTRSEAIGLTIMALCALTYSIMNLLIKSTGSFVPSFQIAFVGSAVETVLSLATCQFLKINPSGPRCQRPWMIVRGVSGAIALAAILYSMTHMPLGDATVIVYLNPVFTAILAAIILHEPYHWFEGVSTILCLLGTTLVTQPGFLFGAGSHTDGNNHEETIGAVTALVGAFVVAIEYIAVRKVGEAAHFMVIVVYSATSTFLMSIPLLFTFQKFVWPQSWYQYCALFMIGVMQFASHCLMGKGLQLAPAGPASVMRMSEVAYAFLFGMLVFNEYPNLVTLTGVVIIVVTTSALAWRKWSRANSIARHG
ncbi:hypothetical protein BDB00DRAFT_941974 [Zychaea mexicana]|uniref:uncharacterized protein n=1 Tax=Zychaea mexicana TaxID=64656 RepID=UPI0022FF406E|nr:uncharacterized protein BDB00DRAFT_941974 [Zychaea mexicana]KAI9488968.1 hypothetical protein BDB00DRAFT_941974 [Zychaea mexicana]